MELIHEPRTNYDDPDRVLAQSIAANSQWQTNASGAIFDTSGTILANSMEDLGRLVRDLGWVSSQPAVASGVNWRALPDDQDDRSKAVRAAARRLGI